MTSINFFHKDTRTRSQLAVDRAANGGDGAKVETESLHDARGQRLVPYVKTAHGRVPMILQALRLQRDDFFVDLGCGDGRVTLAAALEAGAHAVGIDISPALLRSCHRAAAHAGFTCDRGSGLRFLLADMALLFDPPEPKRAPSPDDSEAMEALNRATAFYVYLLPMVVRRLAPFLLRAIARGARVLTLDYHLPSAADADAAAALPSDCQPLVRYLVPVETHLFGQMRLYCDKERQEKAAAEERPAQPQPRPPPQPQQPPPRLAAALSSNLASDVSRSALLAHALPRRTQLPNRHDPFDCTLAAEAVRGGLSHALRWCTSCAGGKADQYRCAAAAAGPVDRQVTIGCRSITVVEAAGDYSTRLWWSSLQLAEWLTRHDASFEDAAVLEVGAGTGLCSLAIATASRSARVVASDVSEAGLKLLRSAVAAQALSNVRCIRFDICTSEALPSLLDPATDADADDGRPKSDAAPKPQAASSEWLVAADVLYTPQLARALAHRCIEMIRRGGRCIVADPGRPTRRLFQSILEREGGFRSDFMPPDATAPAEGRSLILLHIVGERSVSEFEAHAVLEG